MSEERPPISLPVVTQEEADALLQEHIQHWWREPLAGAISLAIGVYDVWKFGRDAGLSSSLDEILIISGVVLIAGSRRLFGGVMKETNGKNGT